KNLSGVHRKLISIRSSWNVAPEYPSLSTIPKAKPLKTWANGRALLAPLCCRIFAVTRSGAYAGFTGRKSSITSRKHGGRYPPARRLYFVVRPVGQKFLT